MESVINQNDKELLPSTDSDKSQLQRRNIPVHVIISLRAERPGNRGSIPGKGEIVLCKNPDRFWPTQISFNNF